MTCKSRDSDKKCMGLGCKEDGFIIDLWTRARCWDYESSLNASDRCILFDEGGDVDMPEDFATAVVESDE
jgi:hypothetical protein